MRDQSVAETLYLTTHNTYKRQTSVFTAGFAPAILANQRPQTNTLDRTNTETG